tara:strand:- start:274 stop:441 length:168 start_codon:yes stop_codon:yes gene_type:complete
MDNALTNIFGLRAIIEAIASGSKLNKIYLQKELRSALFYELNKFINEKKLSKLKI